MPPTILVNPFDESSQPVRRPAERITTLRGKTIGLLDISKSGGSYFLDRLTELLRDKYEVGGIIRASKPTFGRPAPEEVLGTFCHSNVMR